MLSVLTLSLRLWLATRNRFVVDKRPQGRTGDRPEPLGWPRDGLRRRSSVLFRLR